MGKNSKRPKSYYINNAKKRKNNELEPNMIGFLCTCNSKEKQCVREAYNILNESANALYGEETLDKTPEDASYTTNSAERESISSDDSEVDDVETALKDEVANIKKNASTLRNKSRFQQVTVMVHNCIFITTTLNNPLEICLSIMDSIIETQKLKTRNLLRMIPIQKTCKAYEKDIEKSVKDLLDSEFPKSKISFYVAFKVRSNNNITKDICKSLSTIICDFNPLALADYKSPDIVLNVEILRNICCLSFLPKYLTTYCKYNLTQLIQTKETDNLQTEINEDAKKLEMEAKENDKQEDQEIKVEKKE